MLTLPGALPRQADFKQNLCANMQGFSLHAAARCAAGGRKSLAQLCRQITRPALADERVQCNAARQVVLKLRTPRPFLPEGRAVSIPSRSRAGIRCAAPWMSAV